jgi:hypothetical protein
MSKRLLICQTSQYHVPQILTFIRNSFPAIFNETSLYTSLQTTVFSKVTNCNMSTRGVKKNVEQVIPKKNRGFNAEE